MEYEGTVYRPPSEARSLIIQVTVGCAHNRCTFCNMYRVKKFRVRTKEEIMKDLDECRDYYGPYVSRVFFADGDALVVKTELLLELLAYVHKNFPYVERITSYGTAKDVLAKSEEDLKALAAAGLEMVYIGAESGDDRVLEHIHKDVTAAQDCGGGTEIEALRHQDLCDADLRPRWKKRDPGTCHQVGGADQSDESGVCLLPDIAPL